MPKKLFQKGNKAATVNKGKAKHRTHGSATYAGQSVEEDGEPQADRERVRGVAEEAAGFVFPEHCHATDSKGGT